MTDLNASPRQVRINAYLAKRCPRVTHNVHAPDSPEPLSRSDDAQTLMDAGVEFEDRVTQDLLQQLGAHGSYVDASSWQEAIDQTREAIEQHAPAIVNSRLPDVGGRSGAPDVLVRLDDGYVPVDVKNHGTLGRQKTRTLTYSTLSSPVTHRHLEGRSGDGNHRRNDTLQLAHYTRMLQDLGLHPEPRDCDTSLWAGIIGTSDFTDISGDEVGIVWYDLADPVEITFSATEPDHRMKRSPIERYDHESEFRIAIARTALAGDELVEPIGVAECHECEWHDHCEDVAAPDDPSFVFTSGRLDAREWLFLREHGGATIDGLAELDPDDIIDEFTHHAVNKQKPRARLVGAITRARMFRDHVDLEPFDEWPEIPSADVEVDFDIEWDTDQRIYQWGLRVREDQNESTATYLDGLVSFEPMSDASEQALADRCADALGGVLESARAAGQSVQIYHWSDPEVSRTRQFPHIAELLNGRAFDLAKWLKEHFRVRDDYSIKNVAPLFGFSWGVDDAGGFASMTAIEVARQSGPESHDARQWCLSYNECDVAAQAAIRDGLRARPSRGVGVGEG